MSPAGSGRAHFRGQLVARDERRAPRFGSRRQQLRWSVVLVGFGLVAISGLFSSAVGYAIIVGGCALLGAGLGAFGGDASGLRNHRQ